MLFTAENLNFTTHGDSGQHCVLDGLSLHLDSGEIVELRGPSGSGKTTLLRALARLLPGASGVMTLAGRSASEFAPAEWRCRVTLLPQVTVLAGGTVRDNLLLPWSLKVRAGHTPPADDRLLQALADVGLEEIALAREGSRLSVGQAARVALLRVVLTDPDVLLLDEPDAGLDDESAEQVGALVKRFAASGGAVLAVRHQREGLAPSRRLRLSNGCMAEVEA